MPLLYGTLSSTYPEYVSQTVLELLRDHFRISAQRNQLLASELVTILALFKMHDIPVMSFKGPILATSLYQNPAYRECGDLDLLIKKGSSRAKNLSSLMVPTYRRETRLIDSRLSSSSTSIVTISSVK